jgi:hypothetical protein
VAPGSPRRLRRFVDPIASPQSYRNIAYLLLALPLGTFWFAVLVAVFTTAASLLVVALLGVPLLLATWYAVRVFANVERGVAAVLLATDVPMAPIASGQRGNLWVRLKAMGADRARWRELGYLLARFPVGVATFVLTVTAISAPLLIAYTPIYSRYVDDSFGEWFWSTELARFAASAWSWALVPLGLLGLIGAFHLLNAVARACGTWTTSSLGRRAST